VVGLDDVLVDGREERHRLLLDFVHLGFEDRFERGTGLESESQIPFRLTEAVLRAPWPR
jgi:hypothetical protein